MTKRILALTAALILTVLMLASCSSSGEGDSGGDEASSSDAGAAGAERAAAADEAGARDGDVAQQTAYQPERQVIRTGVVSLTGADVGDARTEVQKILDLHRGFVTDEETSTDDDGDISASRLVVRVPSADFTEVMDKLEKVADLESSGTSSEDVTAHVVDNDARIRAQTIGLRRIERLLESASDMRSILRIESEITRRQADLDAMKQQRAYYADQTTMATITVHLAQREEKEPKGDDSGFAAGLEGGWSALTGTAVALATVAGALLPWAVVLAVVGLPLWLLVRRLVRVSRRLQAGPESTPARTPSAG